VPAPMPLRLHLCLDLHLCLWVYLCLCLCCPLHTSTRLERLKETLPVWNPRMDTATMLDEAMSFISSLRRDNRRLEVENELLGEGAAAGGAAPARGRE